MNPTNHPTNERAVEIIDRINYLTLATVDAGGRPWNSPVFFARDEHFNLFWGSHTGARHSQNIGDRAPVAIVIYDSTIAPGQGEGVYIEADATLLTAPAHIARAHQLIAIRHQVPYWKLEQVQPGMPIRLYQARPLHVWMNDEGQRDGHYIDTRAPIQLPNAAPIRP